MLFRGPLAVWYVVCILYITYSVALVEKKRNEIGGSAKKGRLRSVGISHYTERHKIQYGVHCRSVYVRCPHFRIKIVGRHSSSEAFDNNENSAETRLKVGCCSRRSPSRSRAFDRVDIVSSPCYLRRCSFSQRQSPFQHIVLQEAPGPKRRTRRGNEWATWRTRRSKVPRTL